MWQARFEYVPSEANIADLPSRGDLELLRSSEYQAVWFELVWPPVSVWGFGQDSLRLCSPSIVRFVLAGGSVRFVCVE